MTAHALDPADEAVTAIIESLVHELRRADRRPIALVCRGQLAPYHEAAVAWGWLAPTPSDKSRLMVTPIGRSILGQAGPEPNHLPPPLAVGLA
jgi:hypothetical protein